MAEDASSPNEAVIAAKRARALMDKYQITKDDVLKCDNSIFGTSTSRRRLRNAPTWVKIIATASAYLNDCEPVMSRDTHSVSFIFRGFKLDAVVAEHTFDYLISTCHRMLAALPHIKGRSNKNYYRIGFAQEIKQRIQLLVEERKELVTSDGKSLVVSKEQMIKAHFNPVRQARINHTRTPDPSEFAAYATGANDAKRVNLDPQINHQPQ